MVDRNMIYLETKRFEGNVCFWGLITFGIAWLLETPLRKNEMLSYISKQVHYWLKQRLSTSKYQILAYEQQKTYKYSVKQCINQNC